MMMRPGAVGHLGRLGLASAIRQAFDPRREFFSASEQGVWYDPSDLSTLFQDSAGTIPGAVDQPVGLMLDKSKGLVLGPELVTNGGFGQGATGWSTTANVSVAGGAAVFASALNGNNVLQSVTPALSLSKTYAVTYTVVSISSGSVSSSLGGAIGSIRTTPGTYTDHLTPLASTAFIRARSDNTNAVIDNISVRELPGNHAFQATAADRPILRARKNWLVATDVLATQSVIVRPNAHVLSFWGTGSITLSGASTAGPLVGTGVNDRVSLTFTPTAGTLTLTVSGSVLKAQLEDAV